MVPHDRHAVIWFVPNLDFGPTQTPGNPVEAPTPYICPGGYTASLLESRAEIFGARAGHDIIVSDQSQQAAEVGDLERPSVLTFLLGLDVQAVEYVIKALAVLDQRILLFRNAESIQDIINILNTAGLEFGSFIADAILHVQNRKQKQEIIQPQPHEFVEPNTR